MANESRKAATHWAVIIGVNYYPEHYDRCLKGCVQDAEGTRCYLRETIETNADIVVLAASTPSVPGAPPPEKPELWPTYSNVITQLSRIINKAECGDRVYIHYSGHGTQLLSRDKRPELALVLLDCGGRKSKCLRSRTLVNALQNMVEKGLLVTLVLDCCFSGGVVRSSDHSDFDVRFLEYHTAFDSEAICELDTRFSDTSSTLRDASMENNWLVNHKGYTILSACAPHEYAFEIEINGERRGALTYFLLRTLHTLRVNGINLTHHSIHEHLSTSFHAHWSQQTPMRYGNSGVSLFGDSLLAPDNGLVPIYKKMDGHLCLRAGNVHGVFKGDEYIAMPFETPEHANSQVEEGTANVRVTNVRAFESDFEEIGRTDIGQIGMGWKARPLTSLSPWTICIGILPSSTHNGQLEALVKGLRYARILTRQRTGERLTEEACMYNIAVNKHNEYEVVNALLEKVFPIPTIPCTQDGAAKVLADVLQHIGKFKYFEGVENRKPCKTFQASFSFVYECPPGKSNRISVKHGAKWKVTFKNTSYDQLYVGIFNFRPSWEVKPLTSASGFLIVPPKRNGTDGELPVNIRMEVPKFLQEDGKKDCEDHIKVFISSKPTYFRVALPDIFQTACSQNGGLRGNDDLSDLLSDLTNGFRGQGEDGWATHSFFIRTSME